MDGLSWEAWLSKAKTVAKAPLNLRRFDQEHNVVQAALASRGLVLASSLLVNDLVRRG